MNKITVRSNTYDLSKVQSLIAREDVGGVVLGDILCPKKMFDGGIATQILLAEKVLNSGKTLYYQAPLYVTGRNLDGVKDVLAMINGYGKTSYAVVQDFGTASLVGREYKNVKLVWGVMGRVREHKYTDEFLKFLKSNGFVGMETCDRTLVERLIGLGLKPYYDDSRIIYRSLGRTCYLKYQTGICDPVLCRSGRYCLRATDGAIEMSVNGFILGEKLEKIPAAEYDEVCEKFDVERVVFVD
ncbi:MAG: hypothetical protein J1G38_00555 [Clostridiales bacterium]|nr:hypothetical protein [Clostridiales bacterium]